MSAFVQIVIGQIISLFGNAALRFALPLSLLRSTNSAGLYGAVTAFALLPGLAGTLAGGVLADRCRKARLMAALDFLAAACTGAAALLCGQGVSVAAAALTLGALYALQGLYQPVVRASLPLLLHAQKLERGNAVIQTVDMLDELSGPLLGALLLGRFGLRGLLLLCTGCFFLSALLELPICIPQDKPGRKTGKNPFCALRESVCYLCRSQPQILKITAVMAFVNLAEIPALTVGVPVTVVQYLGRGDTALGAVQAAMSIGGLAGGAAAGLAAQKMNTRQAAGVLLGIAGCCAAIGVALCFPQAAYGGVAAGGFCVMAAAAWFNVWFFAVLQKQVPPPQLGRVTACTLVLAGLTQPAGQALYGVLFERFAPAGVWIGTGAVSACAIGLFLWAQTKSAVGVGLARPGRGTTISARREHRHSPFGCRGR